MREQLIERAELNSQPALLVFEFITGATPSSAHLDALTAYLGANPAITGPVPDRATPLP